MDKRWYERAYRRNVVDMHIGDWEERFLSQFDAEKYVEMLRLAQVQSAVVYAQSHVGLCNYPTQVGQMHRGLRGRNVLAEVIQGCHRHGISVVVYCSVIFDRWAYDNHADWRVIRADGWEAAQGSRHGLCCPNSPYRNYAAALAEEICRQFEFEGMRFDMTFWPAVCYCRHCQERFAAEVGGDLPRVINWEDPRWVRFQRRREDWLVEFARLLTGTVKRLRPQVSVEHQASTYIGGWQLGVTERLARENDFLQGDFYGDGLQGSFARKLFYNLSENLPYGFETSVSVDLGNHTAMKPVELLRAKAFASLADGGAFVFIDAIDPVGTLRPAAYERMGRIFGETKLYERYLGGALCQDVGVYLSTESKCDFADNGKRVEDPHLSGRMPHLEAALSVCESLISNHVPFGVVTKRNLDELSRHQIVVLPNVLMIDAEEVQALRHYVEAGGALYASKYTSLITQEGNRQRDFLLGDLFGVSYVGETRGGFTYVAPLANTQHLFPGYSERYPLGLNSSQLIVEARPGTQVLGRIVLPYTDPADTSHFASIHSNPPGIATDYPAVVLNRFGRGAAVYVAGELESAEPHRETFLNLLTLLGPKLSYQAKAPKSVELTMFHQQEKRRFIISLVNFQKELPNIPVSGIKVRVRVNGKRVKRLLLLPEEKQWAYEINDDYAEFLLPELETLLMLALEYEEKS